jgi:hypothetical protein
MTSVEALSGVEGDVERYERSCKISQRARAVAHTFCGTRNASNLILLSSKEMSLPRVEYLDNSDVDAVNEAQT